MQNAVSQRPLLLLLDGHSSHFEPNSIQFAKDNLVIIFCLPPHTTHECQPLDCSLFGPLKRHWQEACHKFYQKNPGKVISKLNFCSVFRNAWLSAVTPANVCGGFKKAGVFPFNQDAVSLPENSSVCSGSGYDDHADGGSRDSKHTHILTHILYMHTHSHTHSHLHSPAHTLLHAHPHTLHAYTHLHSSTHIHTLPYTTRSTHTCLQRLLSIAINL